MIPNDADIETARLTQLANEQGEEREPIVQNSTSKWVRIDDLNYDPVKSYIAKSIDDCDGFPDRGVYEMALELDSDVKCGMVLGMPYNQLSKEDRNV